jgi:transposase
MRDTSLLSDRQWEKIEPLLPPPRGFGRPRAEDRAVLEGILWVLRSGARWRDLPKEYRERQHLLAAATRLGRGGSVVDAVASFAL